MCYVCIINGSIINHFIKLIFNVIRKIYIFIYTYNFGQCRERGFSRGVEKLNTLLKPKSRGLCALEGVYTPVKERGPGPLLGSMHYNFVKKWILLKSALNFF